MAPLPLPRATLCKYNRLSCTLMFANTILLLMFAPAAPCAGDISAAVQRQTLLLRQLGRGANKLDIVGYLAHKQHPHIVTHSIAHSSHRTVPQIYKVSRCEFIMHRSSYVWSARIYYTFCHAIIDSKMPCRDPYSMQRAL